MGNQENVFLKSEGDEWHARNKDKPFDNKRNEIIIQHIPEPKTIVEIGCGNGRYLADLHAHYGARCIGLDISDAAIRDGREAFPELELIRGSAQYKFWGTEYDLVIYGFCLYVCDPESLMNIAAIGNLILRDRGHLVIHDFDPDHAHKVPYHHVRGLFTYKMDWSKLWLSNPAYSLVSKTVIPDGTAVWILNKNINAGWPEEATP